MGRRNPIHVIGPPMREGFTCLSDELIREGGHRSRLGSDGLLVLAYLLSRAAPRGQKAWETSTVQISEQFGWGRNRNRVREAIEAAVKDGRLVIRGYIRDGLEVPRRSAYVVAAGGRRLTDLEIAEYSRPFELPSAMHGKCAS
ncbi:Uncharacterised protein [Mycobacteroides abscessus subsp. massiliense]|uniref:hypothetical protein n=1 Tax=Mycobacteroides abscessus TaxID=36809 RepID=UPI0009A66E14|nr:hypothetical protein [Mycobacteroides abscessus]SKH28925.1 Uncharacterised protein [Mycobacteroides abscessus subsp. massiliense]SKH51636.1 Uncharacterised protein [Mycobacteroides abscessus subsp. massiliense]SKI05557.1 Uncharacterised protein [Mycobacteroides abscessus subsp. massiliense]SKJ89925.1 Uncharacterised protein [Mycobacteroides abscessus subsp. massiliense]